VHDVAREAGVSLATVDRVLNGRPGVRTETIARVEAAIDALDFRRDISASMLARGRALTVRFILPNGGNEFMASLAGAITRQSRQASGERLQISLGFVRAMDPAAMAGALDALSPESCDCAVIVATDDEACRAAVERASERGIVVITLVSDLPGSPRRRFIGIDNVAAGRTAASLMGRFCANGGKVGLIAGSLHLSDHQDRLAGFASVAAEEFPGLEMLGPLEGYDRAEDTRAQTSALLAAHGDLAGIYSMGAGSEGLVRAFEDTGKAGKVRVIAHELTKATRSGLASGAIDVVLDQNPEGEIRAALAAARELVLELPGTPEPIDIGVFMRDNLR
jgi:LacI family transcriptional regulator, galactose operon repressor